MTRVGVSVAALTVAFVTGTAHADDAGSDAEAAADAADATTSDGIRPTTTGDNMGCDIARSPRSSRMDGGATLTAAGMLASAIALRARRKRAPVLVAAAPALGPSAARAQTDVESEPLEVDPPMRRFALVVNPLSLIVNRYGASVELLLASHHAIEAGAYYVYSTTNPDTKNVFRGVGGELGYRFYLERNGFRGFYMGPSFLLAALDAVPANGATLSYLDFGGALDLGWQALVADRVLVGIGAGAQYTVATKTFPQQQIPASVYANDGLRPRVTLSLGVAF